MAYKSPWICARILRPGPCACSLSAGLKRRCSCRPIYNVATLKGICVRCLDPMYYDADGELTRIARNARS